METKELKNRKLQKYELTWDIAVNDFVSMFSSIAAAVKFAKEILKANDDMFGEYTLWNQDCEIVVTIRKWRFNNKIEVTRNGFVK